MTREPDGISLFTARDAQTWFQAEGRRIFLSDVVDPSNSDSMSVGFARYAAGESNAWVVTYDEALIVTHGSYSVTSPDGRRTTAEVGDVIFLREGTEVVYSAGDAGANVVYVTYPHWMDAQRRSAHAALLDTFHPADRTAAITDAVELMRRILGPLERGESDDFEAFYGALADEVTHTLAVGELRGKQAVVDYFEGGGGTVEFRPFVEPLQYYGGGDRAVILGDETFEVNATGVTHRAEWVWVVDVRDGLITRIDEIQDLPEAVAEPVRAIVAKAQGVTSAPPSATDAVALLRSIYEPLERGEAHDFQSFFDALAGDVVLASPVGELRGKGAVVEYFTTAGDTVEFRPFDTPLQYYGAGDRVVILGGETFRVKDTGATHYTEWAWVYDVEDGLITRILAIMDLSGVADPLRELIARANAGQNRAAA